MYSNIQAAVVGSINMDLILNMKKVPETGENVLGTSYGYANGGKGANQAVAAAKQNVITHLIGNVGNDIFGKDLINNLTTYKVDTTYLGKLDNTPTGVAMIIIHNNDNRIILDGGANHKVAYAQIDEALDAAEENDIFITQLENNIDAVMYGLKKAKENNMITIFNPAPAKILDSEIYSYIDYLILNETECEILSGLYPKDDHTINEVYSKLGVKNLIITLGSKGSLLVKENEIVKINPNKVNAVDTTAAGDTYVGVFASQLLKGENEIDALNYASIASSLTCLKEGAQQSIPYEKEVLEHIRTKIKN
jgi:ribokinase